MTDILFVVGQDPQTQEPKMSIQQEIMQILKINELVFTQINTSTIQTLIPFSFLKSQRCLNPFYDFFLSLTIQFSDTMLSMKTSIFAENGSQIKASSQFQRTFLTKYTAAINQRNPDLQVVVHPLHGDIILLYSLWIPELTKINLLVLDGLNILRNRISELFSILEALQLVPAEEPENKLFGRCLQKIEQLRPLLWPSNAQTYQKQIKQSLFQQQDKNTKILPEREAIDLSQSGNLNVIQRMKKTYVQQQLLTYVHNSAKVKLYNFIYLAFEPTPLLNALVKDIQNGNVMPVGKFHVDNFKAQGRDITVQYKAQKAESIGYQYSIVDKLSKKKNYITFLKTYIIARNYLQLTNNYILTLQPSPSSSSSSSSPSSVLPLMSQPQLLKQVQPLSKYLLKNKNVISFDTKLKILSKMASIGCICLERLQNFEPSFIFSNFIVDKCFNFQINIIDKSEYDPKIEILQAFYLLLFGKKYFYSRDSGPKVNNFTSIENQYLKHLGPSVFMKIFIKLLQNYEQNLKKGASLQNILCMLNRIRDIFTKVINGSDRSEESF